MVDKNPVTPSGDATGADKIKPTKGFDKDSRVQPDEASFQSYMQEPQEAGKTSNVSPIDAKQGVSPTEPPTMDSLIGQVNSAQTTISDLQNQLNTPKLKFKSSQQSLLKKKFQESNTALQSAAKKSGADVVKQQKPPSGSSTVEKFISYLSSGQDQLVQVKNQLSSMVQEGQSLNPSQLMLVQVKLAQAQQALEYSSVVLSKVIDDLKQIINIQL